MIQLKNLHFSYQKNKVFNGLSLSFKPGHIYGLLGRNGSGKSTLFKNILGALFPQSGQVTALGYNPASRSPEYLQQVFIVAEEFHLPDVAIRKFVSCNAPFYPKFSKSEFEAYLKEFEIPIHHKLHQMSYGQKKKVLISFALACNTPLLLMDEPSNGLDIMAKSQFKKIIAGAINDSKCVIISTHQVKDLENLIDHITVIDEGQIAFNHSINTISSRLSFKNTNNESELDNALYKEESLKGYLVVLPNVLASEGKTDLELLYKAIVTNPERLNSIFSNPQPHLSQTQSQ